MGRDKALLVLEGQTVLARTVTALLAVAGEIVVAGRTHLPGDCPRVRTAPDSRPGLGPLAGLQAGLRHTSHRYVACVSCDLPYFNAGILSFMAGVLPGHDAVVPLVADRSQPLYAVYDRRIHSVVDELLDRGEHRMSALLDRLNINWVTEEALTPIDPALRAFANINTPDDWRRANTPHLPP